ncbi:uncharacterized protein LOC116416763 [Nasonia vitripennis]|uniref:Uncharacterized protein n=1 Tax=Nasonia vitripennis TaxID=7425 RepID=A0A7M7Q8V1_NASVI|nr:uncharacterized protein LOC116416763 [Nasonia vitripennis]
MNKTCIIILSILLIEGCYSTPVQRTRRQSETATEATVSAEKEPSLEKLETLDSESRDKQDSLAESDGERGGDSEESKELESEEHEAVEEIGEAKEPSLPAAAAAAAAAEEESDDEDEPAVAPKGVEELYRESKAEFEKNGKEEEAGAEKGSAASDKLKKDDELQSAVGDVAPAAGGIFSALSQMWQTVTSLGSSWEHWTRIFNAFTALAGF